MTSGRQPRGSRAASSVSPMTTSRRIRALDARAAHRPACPPALRPSTCARRWTITSESIVDAKIEPCVLELAPQLGRVGQVAVVGERDVAAAKPREHRLRVLDRRRSRRAVAGVADGQRAVERSSWSRCRSRPTRAPCFAPRARTIRHRRRRCPPTPVRDAAASTGRGERPRPPRG